MGDSAPAGIRTRVADSKGLHDWPDYTTGACRRPSRVAYLNIYGADRCESRHGGHTRSPAYYRGLATGTSLLSSTQEMKTQ